MGQQQILLIVLSVILVGIAIAVGITMFQAQAKQGNIDAIISDLNNLGSVAYQYRIRPETMGGGGGSFIVDATEGSEIDFTTYFEELPIGMRTNQNAWYEVTINTADAVQIIGVSKTQKGDDDLWLKRWVNVGPDGILNVSNTGTAGSGEVNPWD